MPVLGTSLLPRSQLCTRLYESVYDYAVANYQGDYECPYPGLYSRWFLNSVRPQAQAQAWGLHGTGTSPNRSGMLWPSCLALKSTMHYAPQQVIIPDSQDALDELAQVYANHPDVPFDTVLTYGA